MTGIKFNLQQYYSSEKVMKHNQITFLSLLIIILFVFTSGCNKDSVIEPAKDTEKPTVSILFPAYGSDVKADTTYTVVADANDNIKVTSVEFYINGQYAGSDSLSPYECRWSTQGLSGSPTIMAKAFDEAGNIGTSVVVPVKINGVANHAPIVPSNPIPADSSAGQVLNPTLRWSCTDPDGDAITYDVFFGISNPPTTQVTTGQSAATLSRTGLSNSTTYYWKVNAKDSKGATITGAVWSFTTADNSPPAAPSNPNPANAATGVSTYPTLSWSCSDPDGDALTYDVFFGTSNSLTTQVTTGQSTATLSRTGLSISTTYYWKVNAKDSKGATTAGNVWSFTTTNPPIAPSNPDPRNAATGVSISPTLSWSCSDPDSDALSYDVFFGTSNPPSMQVGNGQRATTLARTELSNSTTYYWKVNAKDNKGATTTGSLWSFTTSSGVISPGMITVSGGTFTAGSTPVTISSFKIDKYEVTYELWTEVINWALTHGYTDLVAGQNGYSPNGTNNPVTMVNWYDIVKWCNARSEKDGLTPVYYTDNTQSTIYRTGDLNINLDAAKWNANGYRLPTEAEWEFAARGGTSSQGYTYSGSNTIGNVAWYYSNSGVTTHTVGIKSANELGIYDMSGNVWEWCWDWYGSAYPSGGTSDPKGPSTTQSYRALRGGSVFGDYDDLCRVAYRGSVYPDNRSGGIGFRCTQY